VAAPGALDRLDGLLQAALDAAALRLRVTAHNLANVNTPGFQRRRVLFEEFLRDATVAPGGLRPARTHPRHLPSPAGAPWPRPAVMVEAAETMRNDGNNVDVEREMASLAQVSLQYAALTRAVAARYARLRTVIREGR